MVTITPVAVEKIRTFMADQGAGSFSLRILTQGSSWGLELVDSTDETDADEVQELEGIRVVADRALVGRLTGSTIDYEEGMWGSGFRVLPASGTVAARPRPEGPLAEKIEEVLRDVINPGLAAHGGSVDLVELRGQVARLRMNGGCQGCGQAAATMRQGIETVLREAVPELEGLEDVTDHDSGANPYFAR